MFKEFVTEARVGRQQTQRELWLVNFAEYFIVSAIHVCFLASERNQVVSQSLQFPLHLHEARAIPALSCSEILPSRLEAHGRNRNQETTFTHLCSISVSTLREKMLKL